ncbi:hypothetical protein PENTCL1PPCAC_12191, partial [Pristionchus entomophagus]
PYSRLSKPPYNEDEAQKDQPAVQGSHNVSVEAPAATTVDSTTIQAKAESKIADNETSIDWSSTFAPDDIASVDNTTDVVSNATEAAMNEPGSDSSAQKKDDEKDPNSSSSLAL